MGNKKLIGPFQQILTMDQLPKTGPIQDKQLEIILQGGILIEDGKILKVLRAEEFQKERKENHKYEEIQKPTVLIPGLIDSHTHICYGGSRSQDYARRLAGETYLEIAKKGGGILSTVRHTREAEQKELEELLSQRAQKHFERGITTCEVKSGYGLSLEAELKMLRSIQSIQKNSLQKDRGAALPHLISTCLAAHVKPQEFEKHQEYLDYILQEILPQVKAEGLSQRVDIFVEDEAFSPEISLEFLLKAKQKGFSLTVHADQFTSGGSVIAAKAGAVSADHLEASTDQDLEALKQGGVIATVLPGASLGLGIEFSPARKILDAGLCMVIASDWNPGSAPMGDLLMQASVLGAYQKLTLAETLSAMTNRAAMALEISDRGILKKGLLADMVAFPCCDFRDLFYNQGTIKPSQVWKKGVHQNFSK